MTNYTFPIVITLAYVMNFLMMYRKNRIFYGVVFIAISILSIYMAYQTNKDLISFSIVMIILGVVSLVYDTVLKEK